MIIEHEASRYAQDTRWPAPKKGAHMLSNIHFTVERYQVHPGEAQTWVNNAHYEGQRPIREHHVEFLRYLISIAKHRPGTEVALAIHGGREYIINGNHTLHAIIRADKPLWVTLQRYHVSSPNEIDMLYNTFDRQLQRSPRDMLKAYGFAEHSGLSQRQGEVLFSAMRLVLSGFVYSTPKAIKTHGYLRDNELLYLAALKWTNEATWFVRDIAGCQKRWHDYLLRQPILAMALVQYRFNPGMAETFWHQIAHEDHIFPSHPTRLLAKWFQTEAHVQRRSAVELAYITAVAWNAMYTERSRGNVSMPSTEIPILIEGTPYSRKTAMRFINEDWHLTDEPVPYDEPSFRRTLGAAA
jgi:hypothetical protein